MPNHVIVFEHLNKLTLKGHLEDGKEKPAAFLSNIIIVIKNSETVQIENLNIVLQPYLSNNIEVAILLNDNINVVINNVFIQEGAVYVEDLKKAIIQNTFFHSGQCRLASLFLNNASVLLENVTVSNNNCNGIIFEKIGEQSSLTNITVKCNNNCLALGLISSSHVYLNGITVMGGTIQIKNVSTHLSLSDINVSVYPHVSCNFPLLSLFDCGSNISITNIVAIGGGITINNTGTNITLRNITLVNTTKSMSCGLLTINGGISSNHVSIIGIRAVGGSILLSNISNDLTIKNIFTDVSLFVEKCGNNLSIIDSVVVGIITLVYNGNYTSLRNITTIYNDCIITNNNTYNVPPLVVALSGNFISIIDIVIFGGMAVISGNKNEITIRNVLIHMNTTRCYFNPDEVVLGIGLGITLNNDHIILDNITIINKVADRSSGYIYPVYHGIFVQRNRDYITLSDVTTEGYLDIYVTENRDYLTIKNTIQSYQFFVIQNGNNISVVNVTAANNTNLSFQSNGNNITLNNVTITGYSGGCGLVFLYNKGPHGTITFINVTVSESDCGIYAYGWSSLHFLDQPSRFVNNTSFSNGAGMQISRRTTLVSNTKVYFINNKAHGVGGAIYVDNTFLEVSKGIDFCTFQNFAPIFVNNAALVAGNNVYNGQIWKCRELETYTYTKQKQEILSPLNFTRSINCSNNTYLKKFPTPLSAYVTSTPIGVCLCDDNNNIDCYLRSINMQLYPGQYITLSLVTVGTCGGISPSVLTISNSSTVEVLFDSSENQETKRQCKNFTYQLKMNTTDRNGNFLIEHIKLDSIGNQDHLYNSYLTVNTLFLLCPVGLELISKVCQCNHVLSASNVIDCNIVWMPHPIKKSGNNWLYYDHDYNCTAVHRYCPFDYCTDSSLYLSLDNGDVQCSNGRAGILCGGCQMGLSLMLGSNRCHSCENKYLSLVISFILAGMALVAFLLVCNMTVSVGTINGLLFYANIVKLNEVMFFPNGVNVPVLSQFIAWLNLDLGIETCFFDGLDGYWKTWLQFVFPVYIWLLIGAIIVGSHYSSRVCRLCGNNAVPVLATLILMSYTKLLQNVTKSLMSSTINCEGVKLKVWSVDGNIDYLSPKHIPLFVTAMFFLIVGLVYTGLVFTAQWLQRYSGKCCKSSRDPVVKLKPLIDAYTGPYKDKYRFWTGLLLIVRLILTPVFSYTTNTMPQINNYIIAFISAVALYLSRSVYRHKVLNALEAFYFLNLGLLTQINILLSNMGLDVEIVTTVSVSLCFASFIGSILANVYIKKCHRFFSERLRKRKGLEEETPLEQDRNSDEDESYSPSHVITRRESLIFDFEMDPNESFTL